MAPKGYPKVAFQRDYEQAIVASGTPQREDVALTYNNVLFAHLGIEPERPPIADEMWPVHSFVRSAVAGLKIPLNWFHGENLDTIYTRIGARELIDKMFRLNKINVSLPDHVFLENEDKKDLVERAFIMAIENYFENGPDGKPLDLCRVTGLEVEIESRTQVPDAVMLKIRVKYLGPGFKNTNSHPVRLVVPGPRAVRAI